MKITENSKTLKIFNELYILHNASPIRNNWLSQRRNLSGREIGKAEKLIRMEGYI